MALCVSGKRDLPTGCETDLVLLDFKSTKLAVPPNSLLYPQSTQTRRGSRPVSPELTRRSPQRNPPSITVLNEEYPWSAPKVAAGSGHPRRSCREWSASLQRSPPRPNLGGKCRAKKLDAPPPQTPQDFAPAIVGY